MSRPYRINWLAADTTSATTAYLGAPQQYFQNVGLILNDTNANLAYPSPTQSPPFPVPTPVSPALAVNNAPNVPQAGLYGPINYNGSMPQDNIRNVTFTATVAIPSPAVSFSIYGLDENGRYITEVVVGPTATGSAGTVGSRFRYWKILAIIPNQTVTNSSLISVGYGGMGYTMPYQVDYWRKQMQMSFVVENYTGSPLNLTPEITNDQGQLYQNGYMIPQTQSWFVMPGVLDEFTIGTGAHPPTSGQGNMAVAPSFTWANPQVPATTLPITGNTMWSFRSFPIVASRILVNDVAAPTPPTTYPTTSGSFTLVTLQQGGR